MAYKFSLKSVITRFIISAVFFTCGGALLAMEQFTYGSLLIISGVYLIVKNWLVYVHTNTSIAFLFDSIKNNDSTLNFAIETRNRSLNLVHQSLNGLNQYIQKVKIEAEVREKYYNTIIKQSLTGFIVMTIDYKIELINDAASRLAGINPDSTNLNLLKIKNEPMYLALCNLKAGENIVFKNYDQYKVRQLLLKATEIKTTNRNLMLYSILDIRQELNEQEI